MPKMLKFTPLITNVIHTVATGNNVHLQLPCTNHKKTFLEFIARNKSYHEPWVYVPSDAKYFDHYIKRTKLGKSLGFFVFRNADERFVGVINLNNIRLNPFGSASLGYYGEQQLSNKGYMKEGIKLVLQHAFSKIGLNRVEANIQPGNTTSIAFVKSIGFNKEGFSPKFLQIGDQYRDHERWAYLADNF